MKTTGCKYAAEQGVSEEEVLKRGMKAKSKESRMKARRFTRRRASALT